MIRRTTEDKVTEALSRQAAVAIIGPRQVGKTTLALSIAKNRPSIYLDLESPKDLAKLQAPELLFDQHAGKLIILDEIHRTPELFQVLRGVIDRRRREGLKVGQFLILGSASIELLRQSGESLAGRIAYVDMTAITANEISQETRERDRLWLRGGFPDSLLARTDADSLQLREDFIRTYIERDIPTFGPRIPAETLRRFWTMLAHNQGQLLNASKLATSLEVSSPTIARYIDLFVDLLLVRRLEPLHANVGKRLVKSPKVYVRDSGIVHALLRLESLDDLLGHPVVGASWEGFVLESILANTPRSMASFYRTAAGAEIDLVLDLGGKAGRWAIEIKRSHTAKISKGLRNAQADLQPDQSFIVHSGPDTYPVAENIEAISLHDLIERLKDL